MGLFSDIINIVTSGDERKQKETEMKELYLKYQREGDSISADALQLYVLRKESVAQIMRVKQYVSGLKNCDVLLVDGIERALKYAQNFRQSMEWEIEGKSSLNLSAKDSNSKVSNMAMGGVATDAAVAKIGPTTAMAIATTFGTASTGAAISSLGGIAATNIVLSWLGGSALAVAGGSGAIVGGTALLALAGPIGLGVAGIASFYAKSSNEKAISEMEQMISELKGKMSILRPKHEKLKRMISNTIEFNREVDLDVFLNAPNDYQDKSYPHDILAQLVNKCKTLGKMLNEVVIMV